MTGAPPPPATPWRVRFVVAAARGDAAPAAVARLVGCTLDEVDEVRELLDADALAAAWRHAYAVTGSPDPHARKEPSR